MINLFKKQEQNYAKAWWELKSKYQKIIKSKKGNLTKLNYKYQYYSELKNLITHQRYNQKNRLAKVILKRSKILTKKRVIEIKNKKLQHQKISGSESYFLANELQIRHKKIKHYFAKSILYFVLIFYLIITLYPFIWSIFSSFKSDLEIASSSFNPFPENWTNENYAELFTADGSLMGSWILNSFIVAFVGTLGNLVLNTFAGYALARIQMPGRNQIFWTLMALMMVPGQVGLIPNYILLKSMGMTNQIQALIIPSLVNISFIFMSRQFFINFPRDVEEASKIDGQNRLWFIFRTVVPLMRPILMTQAVFSFMGFWNNFMVAKMYIDTPENYTLTLGIQSLLERDAHDINYGQMLAGSTISLIPILILYVVLNSAFMNSKRVDGDK